jgi:hypothetical protein
VFKSTPPAIAVTVVIAVAVPVKVNVTIAVPVPITVNLAIAAHASLPLPLPVPPLSPLMLTSASPSLGGPAHSFPPKYYILLSRNPFFMKLIFLQRGAPKKPPARSQFFDNTIVPLPSSPNI